MLKEFFFKVLHYYKKEIKSIQQCNMNCYQKISKRGSEERIRIFIAFIDVQMIHVERSRNKINWNTQVISIIFFFS